MTVSGYTSQPEIYGGQSVPGLLWRLRPRRCTCRPRVVCRSRICNLFDERALRCLAFLLPLLRLLALLSLLVFLLRDIPFPKRDKRLDLLVYVNIMLNESMLSVRTNPTSAKRLGNIQMPGLTAITVIM